METFSKLSLLEMRQTYLKVGMHNWTEVCSCQCRLDAIDESDVDFTDEPLQEKTEMETETTNIETDTKIGSVDWWTDRLTKVRNCFVITVCHSLTHSLCYVQAFPENGSDLLKEVQQVAMVAYCSIRCRDIV